MNYRPKHRIQLGRPVTGPVDCGPRSWQMAIDNATRGARKPGIDKLRALGTRPGRQPTNVYDAERAFNALGIPYERKVRAPWNELFRALKDGHGVQLCIDYGIYADRAQHLGSTTFRGGHSIYLDALRRVGSGYQILDMDPLFDGRRPGIAKGPQWVRMSILRRAAEAFSGRSGTFWGGIVPPVVGGGFMDDEPERDYFPAPYEEPIEGVPPPVDIDEDDPSDRMETEP